MSQPRWDEQLDLLMHNASTMSDDVKELLTLGAEPLFLPYASSHQVGHEYINYPDIIAGVLDCVANTALLTIDKILRLLWHARLRLSSLAGQSAQQGREISQLLDTSEVIQRRRQRANTAFEFVRGESTLAAKPLAFGVRQVQSSDRCEIDLALK